MSDDPLKTLGPLAAAWGVQTSYEAVGGQRCNASVEALVAVLRGLGCELRGPEGATDALIARRRQRWSELLPGVTVAWQGESAEALLRVAARDASGSASCQLVLETGDSQGWTVDLAGLAVRERELVDGADFLQLALALPSGLPTGYHLLTISFGDCSATTEVFSAPVRAYGGGETERSWGAFVPLYALHTDETWGVGDFRALAEFARWVGRCGGETVATLPLLASFLDEPFEPSPYSPVSRLFWNEVFLDVGSVPELSACRDAREWISSAEFAGQRELLQAGARVDYRAVMELKRRALELLGAQLLSSGGARRAEFEGWVQSDPRRLDYAQFRATVAAQGVGWTSWPDRLRSGELQSGDWKADDVHYHLYVQWLLDQQLTQLSGELGAAGVDLYLDLPVGCHGEGYDAFRYRDVFASGLEVGAPPDLFFRGGQSWGLPPLHPERSRAQGHRYFRDTLAHHLGLAGRLRIDHIIGLARLYCVPVGFPATDGAFVRCPVDEWFAVLCIESHRHQARVVGENLGTVPPEIDELLERHGMQGMYVAQLALSDQAGAALSPPREGDQASLNNHDMPTLAGFERGDDIDLQVQFAGLDLDTAGQLRIERQQNAQTMRRQFASETDAGPTAADVQTTGEMAVAGNEWLGRSPAGLVQVNLEDLWGELEPQNVPGTSYRKHPNWQRKTRLSLEEIIEDADLGSSLERIDRARRSSS